MNPLRRPSRWGRILGLSLHALASVHAGDPVRGAPLEPASNPAVQYVHTDAEALLSDDIQLTQGTLAYGQRLSRFEFASSVSLNTFGLDYQPAAFDFLGSSARVEEHRISGAVSVQVRPWETVTLQAAAQAYQGFSDHRSAWLNEYYRQQFASLPGYEEAAPRGEGTTLGIRLEYLRTLAFVQGGVSYLHDQIAPGYEIDFDGLRRGRPNLHTASYHLAFENVLHRRVRMLHEGRITDTTERRHRFSYQGSINLALSDDWIARVYGGYAEERPTFQSHHVGASLQFEPAEGWMFDLAGRWYSDTGEIENSLFSSAAPGLSAWQVGIGMRRLWGRHSVKFFAAPYLSRYEPAGIGTAFFQHLYQDRTWGLLQAAYATEF